MWLAFSEWVLNHHHKVVSHVARRPFLTYRTCAVRVLSSYSKENDQIQCEEKHKVQWQQSKFNFSACLIQAHRVWFGCFMLEIGSNYDRLNQISSFYYVPASSCKNTCRSILICSLFTTIESKEWILIVHAKPGCIFCIGIATLSQKDARKTDSSDLLLVTHLVILAIVRLPKLLPFHWLNIQFSVLE